MQIDAPCALVPLTRFRPQRLRAPAGTLLKGLRGTTWLTIDHDRRDLVLEPGDEFVLDSDAPAMLSALGGDALVKVSEAAAAARAPAPDLRKAMPAALPWWTLRLIAAR